jgi:hypothetical protein
VTASETVNASLVVRCRHHPLDGKGATLKPHKLTESFKLPSAVARSNASLV